MNYNEKIDFESEDFWINSIKRCVAKRIIRRNHGYPLVISKVCSMQVSEAERLVELDRSFLKIHDMEKREEYLHYYISHKYEDWECKRIIDLNEPDIFEICDGKGQPSHFDFENMSEAMLFRIGKKIAKNLALIKMTDLGYSTEDIEKILGNSKTETIHLSSIMISDDVIRKMKTHFKNMGIQSKRMEVLINLLKFENNLENASAITGLNKSEIEKVINDNWMFKSDNSETILDADKLEGEIRLWECDILVECLAINGMYDYDIDDFSQLSGIDKDYLKRICELHVKFRPTLLDLLDDMASKLVEKEYELEEIIEITGGEHACLVNHKYLFDKYKRALRDETFARLKA